MPEARTKALEVEEVSDELLVYDLETDRAHRLNAAAALVWRRCDGKSTMAQVSKLLSDRFGLPPNPAIVRFALRRLATKRLLVPCPIPAPHPHPSRRELLKKLGLAATALLPAVSTLVAPPPAYAASCLPRTGCVAGVNDCAPCENPGGHCGGNSWRCCRGACVSPGQAKRCGC